VGTARRRLISIPSVMLGAILGTVLSPIWLPTAIIADAIRLKRRFPIARLLAFGVGWAWLESAGVLVAGGLWVVGRRRDQSAHWRLQRWWAANLMTVLRTTTGLRVEAAHVEALQPGPAVVLCRHASLADSLVSAWVITSVAGLHPRYVLKRELRFDPCLDVVGDRVPNYFLDRDAADSSAELAALRSLSAGMGPMDVAVIFPEGTRANPAKRTRALERIAERDPERLARVSPLQHLLPVRPAGSAAVVAGCPQADVVVAWHSGFEGFDTFGGIVAGIGRGAPEVRFGVARFERSTVPDEPSAFAAWLDARWLEADARVGELLRPAGRHLRSVPTPT
jgi:1-acyl-sn-glycerol-3-phosphate acyltransferase